MTNKEIKERVTYISSKGYISEEEKNELWDKIYLSLYKKQYIGNRNCQECIRETIRQIKINTAND